MGEILHFDLDTRKEKTTRFNLLSPERPAIVGITAGASCPNNLIENTIVEIFRLRGVAREAIEAA